jgi:hypothetical protein
MARKSLGKTAALLVAIALLSLTLPAVLGQNSSAQIPSSGITRLTSGSNLLNSTGTSASTTNSTGTNGTQNGIPVQCKCSLYVDLPQAQNGAYLASIYVDSLLVTADGTPPVTYSNTISVASIASGYGFSYWGASSSVTTSAFESQTTGAGLAYEASGGLWLEIYSLSNPALVHFNVFARPTSGSGSVAAVATTNHNFVNGQTAYFTDGQVLSLTGTAFDSGYAFSQWTASAGSLGILTQSATTLTLTTSGNLTLVASYQTLWAGYMESGTGFNYVSTEIHLNLDDPCPNCGGGGGGGSSVAFWVGIGGSNATRALWQAGIMVNWTQNNKQQPTAAPVWNACSPPPGSCADQWLAGAPAIGLTDIIRVTLTSTTNNNTFVIDDLTSQKSWSGWDATFRPDTTTAEWIAEVPSSSYGALPGFNGTTFANLSVNGKTIPMLGPIEVVLSNDTVYAAGWITPTYATQSTGYLLFQVDAAKTPKYTHPVS